MCEFEDQIQQITFYPNRTSNVNQGPYCNVSHSNHEIKRLVKTLVNRDFEPDDLIFLKIKTYTDGKHLEIRTSTAYSARDRDLYWVPHPFAFIKNHVKGKFKFLPIRLHQFEDLWKGHNKESLKADDYEVNKPWTMEINLNITGNCWHETPTFHDIYDREYIGPMGEWFKEAVMAHLTVYLHDFVSECQNQFGGMWDENPYRQVCYVEKADPWRHSVPYVIVECCHFKEKKLTNDGALPIECKTVSESVENVKLVVCISVVIIFLFLPLCVRLIPTRREPYKVMDTKRENTKCDDEADGNENDQLESEAFIPR